MTSFEIEPLVSIILCEMKVTKKFCLDTESFSPFPLYVTTFHRVCGSKKSDNDRKRIEKVSADEKVSAANKSTLNNTSHL